MHKTFFSLLVFCLFAFKSSPNYAQNIKSEIENIPYKFTKHELIIPSDSTSNVKFRTLQVNILKTDSFCARILWDCGNCYCQLVSKKETSPWFFISLDQETFKNPTITSSIRLFQDRNSNKIFFLYETHDFEEQEAQSIGITEIGPNKKHIEYHYGLPENLLTEGGQQLNHLKLDKLKIKYSNNSKELLDFSYPGITSKNAILRLDAADSTELTSTDINWNMFSNFSKIYDNKNPIPKFHFNLYATADYDWHNFDIDWQNQTISANYINTDSQIFFKNQTLKFTDWKVPLFKSISSSQSCLKYTFTWDQNLMQPILTQLNISDNELYDNEFIDSVEYSIPMNDHYIFPLSFYTEDFSDYVLGNLNRRFNLKSLYNLCKSNNYHSMFCVNFPKLVEQDNLFNTNKLSKDNVDQYFFLATHLLTHYTKNLNSKNRILQKDQFLCLAFAKKIFEHLVEFNKSNKDFILGLADVKWEIYNSKFPKNTDPYEDNYPFKDDTWLSDYNKYLNLKSKSEQINKATMAKIQFRLKNYKKRH